jgi:hypothetical protein
MDTSEPKPLSPEEQQQRNIAIRRQALAQALGGLFSATGTHPLIAIHAMADVVLFYIASAAKTDKEAAREIANDLALSLVDLCREVGLTEDEDANGAQA